MMYEVAKKSSLLLLLLQGVVNASETGDSRKDTSESRVEFNQFSEGELLPILERDKDEQELSSKRSSGEPSSKRPSSENQTPLTAKAPYKKYYMSYVPSTPYTLPSASHNSELKVTVDQEAITGRITSNICKMRLYDIATDHPHSYRMTSLTPGGEMIPLAKTDLEIAGLASYYSIMQVLPHQSERSELTKKVNYGRSWGVFALWAQSAAQLIIYDATHGVEPIVTAGFVLLNSGANYALYKIGKYPCALILARQQRRHERELDAALIDRPLSSQHYFRPFAIYLAREEASEVCKHTLDEIARSKYCWPLRTAVRPLMSVKHCFEKPLRGLPRLERITHLLQTSRAMVTKRLSDDTDKAKTAQTTVQTAWNTAVEALYEFDARNFVTIAKELTPGLVLTTGDSTTLNTAMGAVKGQLKACMPTLTQ